MIIASHAYTVCIIANELHWDGKSQSARYTLRLDPQPGAAVAHWGSLPATLNMANVEPPLALGAKVRMTLEVAA